MFSFDYESPRPGLGGVSGFGQYMVAVTRHIYYVREDLAEKFAALFGDLVEPVEYTATSGQPSAEDARTEKAPVEKEDKA